MQRIEVKVLGLVIGTASGWDELDTCVLYFYDFEPNNGINLPSKDLVVDFEDGLFMTYDDDGTETHSSSVLETLTGIN